jgi:predicted membrane channel-forming protein YqfA (hemolysin III family)
MTAVSVGIVFVLMGLFGLVVWLHEVLFVLKGFLPLVLCVSGIVALMAGVSTFGQKKSNAAEKK